MSDMGCALASSVPLDPFAYFPGAASAIAGLGGNGPLPDRGYAFHTPYLAAPSSELRFEGRFLGLDARRGAITIAVHMEVPGSSAPPRVVARVRHPLARLASRGGAFTLDCLGVPGAGYAATAWLSRDADARARALEVAVLPGGASHLAPDPAILAVRADDPLAPLFSPELATFSDPVSQMCTAAQFDEPSYLHWVERLGEGRSRHRKQWEFLFILQALSRHGLLRPGAAGLGFGVGREPLPAVMASMGADVVATDLPPDDPEVRAWNRTDQHMAGLEQLARSDLCDEPTLRARVRFRAADMRAIPPDLRGFDFTWSSCALEHLGSIDAGLRFVEASLACLRPGGVAVHTTEFNLSSNDRTPDHRGTVLFRRRDLERLALRLLAAGHEVAPMKLDAGDTPIDAHVDLPPYRDDPHLKIALDGYATTSFGVVVRKCAW